VSAKAVPARELVLFARSAACCSGVSQTSFDASTEGDDWDGDAAAIPDVKERVAMTTVATAEA
jgi:hypothetical protein